MGKLRPRLTHRAVGSGQSSSHTAEDHLRVRTAGILKFSADSACAPCHPQNEPSAQHGAPGLHHTTHPAGVLQGLCEGASSLGRHHCPPLSTALPPQADRGPSRPSFKGQAGFTGSIFSCCGQCPGWDEHISCSCALERLPREKMPGMELALLAFIR